MIETGGGMNFVILVPLLFFGGGILFILIAFRDGRGRSGPAPTNLSARAKHPLRHVQIALNASRKQAREAAAKQDPAGDQEPGPPRPKRTPPPWLKRVD